MCKTKFCDQLFAEIAAGAFREQRVFRAQFHSARKIIFRFAVFANAHVAGSDPGHRAICIKENFSGGKAGIDLNPKRFRFVASQRQTLPSETM